MRILKEIFKRDKEKFVVPKNAQDIIPIKAIWDDGIFEVQKNKFSKCYKFIDINYAVASHEDKEAMFLDYSDLLNSLDNGATSKITINNRRINKIDFEKTILMKDVGDGLDKYRHEYNQILAFDPLILIKPNQDILILDSSHQQHFLKKDCPSHNLFLK